MSDTLSILDRLIAFPTVSSASNLDLIDYVEDHLRNLGFQTHRVPDETGHKAGLFASIGPTDSPGVMLSAHTDVVPTDGQAWTVDPFRLSRDGGRVFGRGTTDMKGYLAGMLSVAGRAAKQQLKEPLKLAISYDEEVGCIGIAKMINQLGPTIGLPRLAFVGEPTEMQIATGHKGKVAYRADCVGESGHSALAPLFVNALHLATDLVDGLRAFQTRLAEKGLRDEDYGVPYSTVHVGRVIGGRALNIVPDAASVDFELRSLAAEDVVALESEFRELAAAISARYQEQCPNTGITISQNFAYPGLDTAPDTDVVSFNKSLLPDSGLTKVAFGTEAGYFSQTLGIPTVVCGPGSMTEQGHKPDESIAISDLDAADRFFDRLLTTMAA